MAKINLTKGKVSIIDAEDVARVSKHSWNAHSMGYAAATIDGKKVLLHRFVLKAKPGQEIDHINRDKLDNRKSNLRFCTRSENMLNRAWADNWSITWHKKAEKWHLRRQVNGIRRSLGLYNTKAEAKAQIGSLI